MSVLGLVRRAAHFARRQLTPPLPTRGIEAVDIDGLTFFLDLAQHTHRKIAERRSFETELTDALGRTVRPGDVVVDIGANFGWHSLHLAQRQPALRQIYAYEPGQQAFSLAQRSLRASGFEPLIELRRLAVGQEHGSATLKHFAGLGSVNASIYPLGDLDFVEESVEVESLDTLVKDFPAPPAVIKCDVEGGERDVLLGCPTLLAGERGDPPIWFLEANYETAGMAGYFPWELIELAASFAPYRGYQLRGGEIRPMPSRTALRHGDTLVLAVADVHESRLTRTDGR